MRRCVLCVMAFCICVRGFAWGPEGHAIVGKLALQFLKPDIRENVLKVLGGMPIDTAANWMDIMKANSDYEFMRPWHFIDFSEGKAYAPSLDDNLVNRLTLTYRELQHKKTLCDEQVKTDLLVLLHLMGDLHMPLHTGYEDDLGGNKRALQYDTLKNHNLHWFWDEDIIRLGKISYEDCLAAYQPGIDTANKVDFVKWMHESRSFLPKVYELEGGYIASPAYFKWAKTVVTQRLVLAGVRLAAVLEKLFYSSSPAVDFTEFTKGVKNGILASEAAKFVGKEVTICERVYSIRETSSISQISLGGKNPNHPVTVVIFSSSYKNFPKPISELFTDRNVCVTGKVQDYKGKAQIVVEKAEDLRVLK